MKKTTFCPFEIDRETDPKHVARGERCFLRNDVHLDYVSVKEKSKIKKKKNCRRKENAPGCRRAERQIAGESQWRRRIKGMEETGPVGGKSCPHLAGMRPQALPMMFFFPMVSGRVQVGLNLLGSSDHPALTSCMLRPKAG